MSVSIDPFYHIIVVFIIIIVVVIIIKIVVIISATCFACAERLSLQLDAAGTARLRVPSSGACTKEIEWAFRAFLLRIFICLFYTAIFMMVVAAVVGVVMLLLLLLP